MSQNTENTYPTSHPASQDELDPVPVDHHNSIIQCRNTPAPPEALIPCCHQAAKATITIATLNINGFIAPSHNMSGIEKWSTIYHTMCDQKIAILVIQETHLDDKLLSQVERCYGKCLTLITFPDPTSPHASAGVAFAINKCFIKPSNITVFELFEGHALALKIKWHSTKETTLLNIYAPNSRVTQLEFWRKIDMWKRLYRLCNPDFMLGDFNITEDNIDCSPLHPDDPNAITAIRERRHQ